MFDVIHVLYEEDVTPTWEQHIDVKNRIRETLSEVLYERPYRYGRHSEAAPEPLGPDGEYIDGVPVNRSESGTGVAPGKRVFKNKDWHSYAPDDRAVKPYIPVTPQDRLMQILDVPMGEES